MSANKNAKKQNKTDRWGYGGFPGIDSGTPSTVRHFLGTCASLPKVWNAELGTNAFMWQIVDISE